MVRPRYLLCTRSTGTSSGNISLRDYAVGANN